MSRIHDRGVRWADRVHDVAVLALFLVGYAQTDTWPPRIALIVAYLITGVCAGWITGGYITLQNRTAPHALLPQHKPPEEPTCT